LTATARKRGKKQGKTIDTLPLYVALVIVFVAYFIFEGSTGLAVILGALIFFLIVVILVIEVMNGFKEVGAKRNLMEIAVAVILVLVIWLVLRFALNTAYPLDVVPSCSMLPVLQRGDMIVVQGANQDNLKAPIINVTRSEWNSSFSNINAESLQCVAYSETGTTVKLSQFVLPGYTVGLLKSSGSTAEIVPSASQNGSLVKYTCGIVNVTFDNGTVEHEASTTAITIGNTTITGDRNNSIVVYQTVPADDFYKLGDSYIVHRVYAILNVSGTYYTLTKGDNNPGLDIQYLNAPANLSQGQVGGKVVASIPYIGYVKLILSNNFVEPTGCNYTTSS
jgi:signal peptidase I